jgi:hypothetical protein
MTAIEALIQWSFFVVGFTVIGYAAKRTYEDFKEIYKNRHNL